MDVKIIKLVTGEWVLSECVDKPGTQICLKNPCLIVATEEGIAMGPMSPFSNGDNICISLDHILFIDTPNTELKNGYAEKFGGIALPGSNINLV